MSHGEELIPKVILSDWSGQEYMCFEFFASGGEWSARLVWELFREDQSSLRYGWSLRDSQLEATFDLAALAQVETDDSGYPVGLVDAIVAFLERSPGVCPDFG